MNKYEKVRENYENKGTLMKKYENVWKSMETYGKVRKHTPL